MITFADVQRLDIRIGTVAAADRIPKTDRLIRLMVDIGAEQRQVVAGMGDFLEPEHFVGRQVVILANLAYRKFCGVESQGMLMATDIGGRPVLLCPEAPVPPGSRVR